MNFKKIFLLNLVVFFSIVSYSQNTIFLNWISTDENGVKLETFENSTYLQDHQGLPSYQRMTKLKSSEYYEIELFDIEYTSISEIEKIKLSNLDVSDSIIYSSDVLKSANNYYSRILVFPYIKTENNYKKITKFSYRSNKKRFFNKIKKKSATINSVLKDGDWYKISVSENGVFQLTFSDLQTLGINTNNLNVNSIRLYGNGGGMLARLNSDFRHQDLQENAIEIVDKNSNGIFESGDYLLFYGEDVDQWKPYDNYIGKYHHYKHLYDDFNYYFITINGTANSKRIGDYTNSNKGEIEYNDKFNFHEFHEEDLTNLIKSGEQWYGEEFDADLSQTFSFSTPNIVDNSTVHVKANIASRAFSTPNFSFDYNNSEFMNIDIGVVVSGFLDDYAKTTSVSGQFSAVSDNLNIDINFNRNSSSHKGWLNYIEVCGFRDLTMSGSQMTFRKTISSGFNQTSGLIIENVMPSLKVWRVTDPTNVTNHDLSFDTPNTANFGYNMSIGLSDEKFIAFDGMEYKTPNLLAYLPNQNLHGDVDVEMLIVSHPDFLSAAQNLADFHLQKDGSKCKVVTPQQVFNEFSSGKQDISAIRDYCKYLYDLPDRMFKYLLIIGDASYDPKDRIPNNTNFVITYQSNNSLGPLDTYSTDDYFGYLDNNEGELNNDLVDIGIGRLPAKTLQEANNMVNKIIHYYDKESMGSWRNYAAFIADDGDDTDGNIHMDQSDNLCDIIDDNYNNYNFDKLYLDIFNQESTPAGPRSEGCRNAINRRIDKGALIVNYTGHGGESGLTSERIIDIDQIQEWKNYDRLPLFVTATCEFGRLDNPELTSGGEHIILSPDGGGVALLTTTRYVFSYANNFLNTNFINSLFEKTNGNYPTLGDILLQTKVLSGTSINSKKFTLLGDPMMSLAYPEYGIKTTIIPDTLSALEKVTFEGEIIDEDSVKVSSFNGEIDIIVFDKEFTATTQGQQSSTPMPYKKQDNIIYKGKSSVTNGVFSFTFIVPKDIDYNLDFGRISYYAAESVQNTDASGWNESFIVGGVSSNIIPDDMGPSIQLYMNDKQFVSGSITNSTPVFLAFLEDSSGINTVGNGIGHDITITLDGETSNKVILNDYYEAELDNYQKGKVEYLLNELDPGLHTIDFKVWDVHNNSSEATLEFVVASTEDFVIEHLLNYPNPFTTNTSFYFEHNRPNQNLEVQIQIFTVSGKLVKTINSLQTNTGFRVGPISWDGRDDFQDNIARGTYIYKLKVKDMNGEFIEKLEKLVILK